MFYLLIPLLNMCYRSKGIVCLNSEVSVWERRRVPRIPHLVLQ
jgi:hypothetical protein